MSDPRDEFLSDVNFAQVEVREYPKIAFLCGGSPTTLRCQHSHKQLFPSVRSLVAQLLSIHHSELHYQNAEDVKDWNSYSAYEDLIEFEKDIAHICKAIVLFVESPGSIAELGAFSMIGEIMEKLIIFVSSDYSESMSFVSLGPLKKINNLIPGRIHFISWSVENIEHDGETLPVVDPESMKEWGEYTCSAILDFMEDRRNISHESEGFRRTKEALLVNDLVVLFKAVTIDELEKYFFAISHKIDKKSLGRSLFCLEKLGLIVQITRGNKSFYLPGDMSGTRYLTLKAKVDTARLAARLVEYYQHKSHLARREAIAAVAGGAL